MRQQFAAAYGRVVIENRVLHIRNVLTPFFKTGAGRILWAVGFVAIFAYQFTRTDKRHYEVGIVVWGLLLLTHGSGIWDVFFKRSYATRIPLQRITGTSIRELPNGLETEVRLHLTNGRYRTIVFRKLEGQTDAFVSAVGSSLPLIQSA